jgi:UPF0716 family protein affecting phage T7 exclusion
MPARALLNLVMAAIALLLAGMLVRAPGFVSDDYPLLGLWLAAAAFLIWSGFRKIRIARR